MVDSGHNVVFKTWTSSTNWCLQNTAIEANDGAGIIDVNAVRGEVRLDPSEPSTLTGRIHVAQEGRQRRLLPVAAPRSRWRKSCRFGDGRDSRPAHWPTVGRAATKGSPGRPIARRRFFRFGLARTARRSRDRGRLFRRGQGWPVARVRSRPGYDRVAADGRRARGGRPPRTAGVAGDRARRVPGKLTANEPVATAAGIAVGNTLEAVAGALAPRAGRLPPGAPAPARRPGAARVRRGAREHARQRDDRRPVPCRRGVQPWSSARSGGVVGRRRPRRPRRGARCSWSGAPQPRVVARRGVSRRSALVATRARRRRVLRQGREVAPRAYPLHYYLPPRRLGRAALRTARDDDGDVPRVGARDREHRRRPGPFALATPHESLLLLQFFMASSRPPGCCSARPSPSATRRDASVRRDYPATRDERGSAASRARGGAHGRLGLERPDRQGRVEREPRGDHGLARVPSPATFGLPGTRPPRRSRARRGRRSAARSRPAPSYEAEFRNLRPDGGVRWIGARPRAARRRRPCRPHARDRHGRHGAPPAREELRARAERAGRRRPPQGRVPRDARARAAQSARADRDAAASPASRSGAGRRAPRSRSPSGRSASSCAWSTICSTSSRITQGKISFDREPVQLGDVVDAARVETSRPAVDSRSQHAQVVAAATSRRSARRRSDAARAGRREPARQRRASTRRAAARSGSRSSGSGDERRAARARHGAGIAPELAAARLRSVRAGRPSLDALAGRPRHRADARAAPGRAARRARRGAQRGLGQGSEFVVGCRALDVRRRVDAAGTPPAAPPTAP